MLSLVGLFQCFDVLLIEAGNYPYSNNSEYDADEPEQGREIQHGAKGKEEPAERIEVYESVLKEIAQRLVCFSKLANRGATVIILMPLDR